MIIVLLVITGILLAWWIANQRLDQSRFRSRVIENLSQLNALLNLLQVRRQLMTDTKKSLSQNEVRLLSNNTDIEKLVYSLDLEKTIQQNDYWVAFLDHWKRLKNKVFSTSGEVLYQQHSHIIEGILKLKKELLNLNSHQELFTELQWLSECTWYGVPEINEQLQRIAHAIKSEGIVTPGAASTNNKLFLYHLNQCEYFCQMWLAPFNKNDALINPNLIMRTLSSCERVIRICTQELYSTKNHSISVNSISSLINEALSNLTALQQQQIRHLKLHYHLKTS